MAKKSVVTMTIAVNGDGINTTYNPVGVPIVNTDAPAGGPISVALAAGDNTITVPPNAQGMIIVPPVASTNTKKIKGDITDTGVTLSPIFPAMISLPTGALTIIINSLAPEIITVEWI